MKKLMFGMAVAAGLMACADIESANVVGYGSNTLKEGATMCAPTFVEVGTSGDVKINSLIPTGENLDGDGAIAIQTLDAFGRTVDMYFWIDWGGDDVGWMNDEFEKVDITFSAGQGLWVMAQNAETFLQTSGEVNFNDRSVQLKEGATGTGNMTASSVSIQDLVVEGEEIDGDGAIAIQTLDAFGRTVDMYFWIDWGGDDVGWMNDEFEKVDVTFEPGQGLWVMGQNDTTYLRFPAPETK